ncbi:chitin synthase [Choanephora cucurbitarum]|nr:chitin synthase [Choanephora cucurbitarum]
MSAQDNAFSFGVSYDYSIQDTALNRSKSLTRPERQRPRVGLISSNPNQQHHRHSNVRSPQPMPDQLQLQLEQQKQSLSTERLSDASTIKTKEESRVLTSWWAWTAFICTCCFPNCIIRICFGKPNRGMQQAWREKVTLCYLIAFLCGALAYITYGLNIHLCPPNRVSYPYSASSQSNGRTPVFRNDYAYVFGQVYDFRVLQYHFSTYQLNLTDEFRGVELGSIFDGDITKSCLRYNQGNTDPAINNCSLTSPSGTVLSQLSGACLSLVDLHRYGGNNNYLSFNWNDIHLNKLFLLKNNVIDLNSYFSNDGLIFGSRIDTILRRNVGNDITYALSYTKAGRDTQACLLSRYSVGIASQEAATCVAENIIMTVMFIAIITIIVIRFSMACLFQWLISHQLVKPGGRSNWLAWRSIRGGNNDPANHVPGPYNDYGNTGIMTGSARSLGSSNCHQTTSGTMTDPNSLLGSRHHETDIVDTELYTVMLVTCYSEGEEGLKTTMDSLSNTTYSNKHKIFFVIADGLITGAGETKSTPDILIDMLTIPTSMANPKPCSYLAVSDGEKQLNMAKVYAGYYNDTACVAIIKCGTDEEQQGPKAGNRGKRDSQVILMSFFQHVLFNDRLSELDYEIFWKMTWLMKGVTPDKFETVLMVDADTQVLPDALTYMVAAMANDITIMGLCGETRIANKRSSWVTAIQVFEYYISHHYSKAFESLFGMVTCLPGCFSMYRIKAPKNGAWVPILASPDIILEYNQNVVTTLHEKNLLLLGEDRFLSTLMLRSFPKRQMMFVPQARCRTVVPDEFGVLLSQRRRWINSTVHNLMELVLVSDLCGISFLSMQFSVFIDLIGTFVLPAAIVMTIYLIIQTAITPHPQWQSLGLLIAILFLPAVLILLTTFKLIYILWLIVYIFALPVWNFVLPVYSYWHFDDFSWGATRVVVGEKKGEAHGDAEGQFDSKRLILKRWEDWEAERTGKRQSRKLHLKTPSPAFDNNSPKSSLFYRNLR